MLKQKPHQNVGALQEQYRRESLALSQKSMAPKSFLRRWAEVIKSLPMGDRT